MRLKKAILLACLLFLTVKSAKGTEFDSLSELNFKSKEDFFLSEIPWPKKDPFIHPTFEIKLETPKEEIAPVIIKEPEPPALELSAILYSNESSSAVINGMVVKAGGIVKSQKVLEIKKDCVKVEFNGMIYEIKLKEFSIRGDEN